MLSDLDPLMADRGIGLILVPMHDTRDPSFRWLSRGAKLTQGFVAKRLGADPLLIHFPMEREEARQTGLPTVSALDLGWDRLSRESTAPSDLYACFFRQVIGEAIDGSFALLGNGPIALYHRVLARLREDGVAVWSGADDLIRQARKRKDDREIGLIRSVGGRTEQVVEEMATILRRSAVEDGLLSVDGGPLTIGHLKDFVSKRISELGMVEDHDTILSQADEAGVPHCRGTRDRPVRAGEPIVIDIFPADRDSGYFFDYTRTFLVGEPSSRFIDLYGQVVEAFDLAVSACRAGMRAADLQHLVCDYFEKGGHATTRQNASTTEGYVHGLGHGVGLEIHELPSFSINPANEDRIEIGDVLTIEPGLYYPDEGIGIRIEETFVVDRNGLLESLCERSRDWRI